MNKIARPWKFPAPPPARRRFIGELRSPPHGRIRWERQVARAGEISLAGGLSLDIRLDDPAGLLDSACRDFCGFLEAAGISARGSYPVRILPDQRLPPESFRITAARAGCAVACAGIEAARRALTRLEYMIRMTGGPLLPAGSVLLRPQVRDRIRWACFGQHAGAYPEGYLVRLARDGANGLVLPASFRDLCRTAAVPEWGRDAGERLARLGRLVRRCRNYGIRLFLYVNEPRAFDADDPVLAAHPELAGKRVGRTVCFCTGGAVGRAYLREAVRFLFENIPDLGGLIDITVGERPTHCHSGGLEFNNCPRCAGRPPALVLAEMLEIMEQSMRAVAPQALMISWPYTQYALWGIDRAAASAGRMPPGTAVMYNFESAGRTRQLGQWRYADDYWLSYVGPSDFFKRCAANAVRHGNRMFAKLTVAASHEVGTAVCVPAPGILYDKYRAMHKLHVSGALETWDFGSYPSLMTQAAGLLSFQPLPPSKSAFLAMLARLRWGTRRAPAIIRAWRHFESGYRNVPLNILFSYYGPLHNSPVWPLYLRPRDTALTPKWMFGWPAVDGDRIGECIAYAHTLDETITLCRRLVLHWRKGVAILRGLVADGCANAGQAGEIRAARALGIQFESALNVLRFYRLREQLWRAPAGRQSALLGAMRSLARREILLDRELLPLAEADAHLGFRQDAGGHLYFPAAIRWRMNWLRRQLAGEFRQVAALIRAGKPLFPEYTGARPAGRHYACRRAAHAAGAGRAVDGWKNTPAESCGYAGFRYACAAEMKKEPAPAGYGAAWQAYRHGQALEIKVSCGLPAGTNPPASGEDCAKLEPLLNDLVLVYIEPRRLWPPLQFMVNARGARYFIKPGVLQGLVYRWQAQARRAENAWTAVLSIPLRELGMARGHEWPLRVNIGRQMPDPAGRGGFHYFLWHAPHPWPPRLVWNTFNPADLGWMIWK